MSSVRPAAHGIAADTVVERPGEMCWCSAHTGLRTERAPRRCIARTLEQDHITQTSSRRYPGPRRQHLEVNRQGSSTSVKQMACNGPTARPCRVSDRPGILFVPKMRQECVLGTRARRQRSRHGKGLAGHAYEHAAKCHASSLFCETAEKKRMASSSPTDEGCPDQVAKRTTHMGDIS